MKKTRKTNRAWPALLIFFLWLHLGVTQADNIHPPSYFGSPNSLVAIWSESTPGMGDWVSGSDNLSVFDSSHAVDPITQEDLGCGPGAPCLRIVDANGLLYYEFYMPNVVNDQPTKLMRVQITYSGSRASIGGYIGDFSVEQGPHVFDEPINPQADGYHYSDLVLWPSPDWEGVYINQLRDEGLLHQVVIHTGMVPVPAAVWLFGSGLIGLIGLARRKANV